MAMHALLLLGLVATCYGVSVSLLSPRIVNGENAKPGEIPYQVSIGYKNDNSHFCGGSVLNQNYIITAAHCVQGETESSLQVVAGTVDLNVRSSVHNVEGIIVHEAYDFFYSFKNDIALVKVVEPFVQTKFLSFVTLPKKDDVINVNDVAVVSGWGRLWYEGHFTKQLQRVNIYIADQEYCRGMYKNMNRLIHDSQVCAYDPQSPKGSCFGDSGGPLTVNGKLVGLVCWAKECGLTDYPTVFTRVSEFIDWIETHAV